MVFPDVKHIAPMRRFAGLVACVPVALTGFFRHMPQGAPQNNAARQTPVTAKAMLKVVGAFTKRIAGAFHSPAPLEVFKDIVAKLSKRH